MHEHNHKRSKEISNLNTRFITGIVLNIIFVLVEAGCGIYYNSLALLSDAGHNLSDVASLLLALLAFRLAKIKPDSKFTYGYRKTTILVSLVNAVILALAMGSIIWESIHRIKNPAVTNGNPIAFVAGIGIAINGITAWLFLKDKEKDLNIKGAYLNMLSDTLVSLGVLIAGLLMTYTNWYWLDGVISILIAVVVFLSTFQLLRSSFNLSIDAVPEGIDLKNLKKEIEEVEGVINAHHIHVWAISTTLNAFTAHIKIKHQLDWKKITTIKKNIRHVLLHHNILHSTLEFETNDDYRNETDNSI